MEYLIKRDKTKYYSHTLAGVSDGENINDWILVKISRTGK